MSPKGLTLTVLLTVFATTTFSTKGHSIESDSSEQYIPNQDIQNVFDLLKRIQKHLKNGDKNRISSFSFYYFPNKLIYRPCRADNKIGLINRKNSLCEHPFDDNFVPSKTYKTVITDQQTIIQITELHDSDTFKSKDWTVIAIQSLNTPISPISTTLLCTRQNDLSPYICLAPETYIEAENFQLSLLLSGMAAGVVLAATLGICIICF